LDDSLLYPEQLTTVNVKHLEKELNHYPDPTFVSYIINGFRTGFHTGVTNSNIPTYCCQNLLSARRDPETVSKMLSTELQKGYMLGPFENPPFDQYRISPIGIAEHKYSGKKRLIVDLSAPHDNPNHQSINNLIPKEEFSLSYVKIDDAIRIIQSLGSGSWLCKFDIADAFKHLPIHRDLWHLHGIKWQEKYYFYTRLVFGSRSSPKIFDTLSQAICWIATNNYGVTSILHLLDDFLTIDSPQFDADRTMALLTMIFKRLNIPLSEHKTVGPVNKLEYLGIILDSTEMKASLPQDKLSRINCVLHTFYKRDKCTKRELLSLLGHLNFACRVIPAGRSFISRLLETATSVKKLHYRVHLNTNCRADICMWQYLLAHWNGVSFFLDNNITKAHDMYLFTDAAGSTGFGGFYKNQWFQGTWPDELRIETNPEISIAFQEMYPVVVAAMLWGCHWECKRIMFYCDNQATVHIINKGRSKSPAIMKLMRRLVITAGLYNFSFVAEHVPGVKNSIADALSRFQMSRFRELAPHAQEQPCQVPCNVMFD